MRTELHFQACALNDCLLLYTNKANYVGHKPPARIVTLTLG